MQVEIYSDIACPWCYIGETRFFRALAAFANRKDVDVVFRPFQLDPTLPEEPRPLKEQLVEKFGPRTEAMLRQTASTARTEGLELNWDEAVSVNTLTAHRLLQLAEREYGAETQRKLATLLFEAHFTDGKNVRDVDVLSDLAASVGMDRDRTMAYLASDEGRDEVLSDIERAQRIGVRAVPTFVFNGESAVQGAQPTSVFLQALEELHQEAVGAAADGEGCADGSCAV